MDVKKGKKHTYLTDYYEMILSSRFIKKIGEATHCEYLRQIFRFEMDRVHRKYEEKVDTL